MDQKTTREIDETAASWSYAELWDRFPIPARPDDEEIALEESAIRKSGKTASEIDLMILGSTIEYRSLCQKLGIAPDVIDFSQDNFDSLTAYSSEKFTNEHFIERDWLEVDKHDFYDFILGHRPFNVIRRDQIDTLFQHMHDSLKTGGVFFCRGNVKFVDDKDRLDSIVDKWGRAQDRPYRLFSYLEVPLYSHCADSEGYLDYPKARETIKKYFDDGKITESDYKDIAPLISMPAGTKFISCVPKKELEESIAKAGFSSAEWLFTSHEFTSNMPIIKLTR